MTARHGGGPIVETIPDRLSRYSCELLECQLDEGGWDEDNGARDGGPYRSITGAQELRRDDASIPFPYDGPTG